MNQAVEAVRTPAGESQPSTQTDIADMLRGSFRKQREAYLSDPIPDADQRKQDLLALKKMLADNRERLP